jgi:hypothetical protein
VGVIVENQYEVGDRIEEVKMVGMGCMTNGERWKPAIHHALLLNGVPLCHAGKFLSKLVYVTEVRNYGQSFIYQV